MLKKIIFALLLVCTLTATDREKSTFQATGDVLRLLPIFVGVVSLIAKDYRGVGQLVAGSLAGQGVIEIVKRGFEALHKNGVAVSFAKRPCCEDYKGMPSGHAGGAFSAAGFVFYRYGVKLATPVILLAVITDASRIYAQKHTIWQVLVGSFIAWVSAWVFTNKRNITKKTWFEKIILTLLAML